MFQLEWWTKSLHEPHAPKNSYFTRMVHHYNPHITRYYNHLYTLNNQGFFISHMGKDRLTKTGCWSSRISFQPPSCFVPLRYIPPLKTNISNLLLFWPHSSRALWPSSRNETLKPKTHEPYWSTILSICFKNICLLLGSSLSSLFNLRRVNHQNGIWPVSGKKFWSVTGRWVDVTRINAN